jgi:hypothetical protein
MEARADFLHRLREHVPHLHLLHRQTTSTERLTRIGLASGIGGGVTLGATLFVYDWANGGHSALELPSAATGWLFGLEYFGQNDYRWWPILIGAVVFLAYWGLMGLLFAGLADRVYHVRTLMGTLALGAAWSFASFMFFWYMLLPIARDGAPFRLAAAGEFVAPNWVWILGFTLAGLATGICYRELHARERAEAATAAPPRERAA